MTKPQRAITATKPQRAITATKTKAKLKAPTKKKEATRNPIAQSVRKQKPEASTDSEESLDPEPTHLPHRKCAKESVEVLEDVINIADNEPEVVTSPVSGSDGDDTRLSDKEV
jgi:hypothetical protein